MQVRVNWVLRIFGTQVIKKKWPVRPLFPDYLSVSYDYVLTNFLLKITDVFMGYRTRHIHTYTHNIFAILKFSLTQGLKQIIPG